jgi:hypothetical protein
VRGLLSQFGVNLVAAALVTSLSVSLAVVLAVRRRRQRRPALPDAARVLAIGSVVLILVTTALPNEWPIRWVSDGDLILQPGMGGLRTWRAELARFPQTLASILLVANVVVYMPLTFFGVIGWGRRALGPLLLASLGISVFVEAMQYLGLGRVAATDDVIVNMLGGLFGVLLSLPFLGRTRSPEARAGREDPAAV